MGAKFCLGKAIMSSRVERETFSRSGSEGVPANSPCEKRETAHLSAAERDRDVDFPLTSLKSSTTATLKGAGTVRIDRRKRSGVSRDTFYCTNEGMEGYLGNSGERGGSFVSRGKKR